MIMDDYIGKPVIINAEGGQLLGGDYGRAVFLGLENIHGVVMVRALHYHEENQYNSDVEKTTIKKNDVFVQLRKIKSLHFEVDEKEENEILAIIGLENIEAEFKEF